MGCTNIKGCLMEKPIAAVDSEGDKPPISRSLSEMWQNIIDTMTFALNVSTGLVIRHEKSGITIFLRSKNPENPFKEGESHKFLSSLYMKTVIGNRGHIILNNLSELKSFTESDEKVWNMNLYLGFPVLWPDGQIFGTICILDNGGKYLNEKNISLVRIFKESMEKDLELLFQEQALNHEMGGRKRIEQDLMISENKYTDLFNNIRSSVLIFKEKEGSEDFVFADLNEAAERTSVFNKKDIIGKSLSEVFPSVENTKLLTTMKEVMKTGIPSMAEVFYYQDGRICGWRDNYRIYKTENNHIVIIYDDASENINYKKTIEENNKLIYEKVQYEEIRSEFFSNISHELRTPINVISSAVQLMHMRNLMEENPSPIFSKYLRVAEINCSRLLRTINNIIEMTEIEVDYYDMKLRNIDIVKVVKDITDSVKDYLSGIDRKVVFHSEAGEKIILGDKDKIEHIMLNLLSNSVKFTEKGGKIDVRITKNKEWVSISVKDNGIGIPDEKKDVIFEKFRQVDKSLTRSCEGSGIGLSLVKALVEKHNGKIQLKTVLGVGSEFIIQFPCIDISDEAAADEIVIDDFSVNLREKVKFEFSDIYELE